jgi:hypothetical protein
MNFIRATIAISLFLLKTNTLLASSSKICSPSDVNSICNQPGDTRGGRIKTFSKTPQKDVNQIKELLNLKNQVTSAQLITSAIEINQTDILNAATQGNSWVRFDGTNELMVMNIGSANNSIAQTWSLPADFMEYFEYYSQYDFLSLANAPAGLNISGATHVTKSLGMDEYDNDIDIYDYYNIGSTTVTHLGTSFDMETDVDDTFDEPDFEYMKVPFKLGDVINAVIQKKDPISNLNLVKKEITLTVDAFGTINIPSQGTFNCLRGSYVENFFTRSDESSPFVLESTKNSIGFYTKQGHFIYANVVSLSGSNATLEDVAFQTIMPTALLSTSGNAELNNNQQGVSINTNQADPDSSAILDVSSTNKGILIPRITEANRPANPAEGLLIYQVDNTPGFYYFDGTDWQMLASTSTPFAVVNNSGSNARVSASNSTFIKGRGSLKKGKAFIKFDSAQENFEDLILNIQAEGECNGFYVSKKSKEGFEIKELKKGKSNVKFSWKIE